MFHFTVNYRSLPSYFLYCFLPLKKWVQEGLTLPNNKFMLGPTDQSKWGPPPLHIILNLRKSHSNTKNEYKSLLTAPLPVHQLLAFMAVWVRSHCDSETVYPCPFWFGTLSFRLRSQHHWLHVFGRLEPKSVPRSWVSVPDLCFFSVFNKLLNLNHMLLKHGFGSPFRVLNWRIKFQVFQNREKYMKLIKILQISHSGLLSALFWLKTIPDTVEQRNCYSHYQSPWY